MRIEVGVDVDLATAEIEDTGAEVTRAQGRTPVVAADEAQLDAVADVLDVAWIEDFVIREKHNEFGAGVIMGANAANANGYDGTGQIVAVADTGIGGGTAATAHDDIPASRIVAVNDWPAPDGAFCWTAINHCAIAVDIGYGTHVATSVLGGGGSGGEGTGTAPGASLIFQAVEDWATTFGTCAGSPDNYYLIGIPDDIGALFQQAYTAGARVHTSSWGCSVSGAYTLDAASADGFIWHNPAMTIVFSAGNTGTATQTVTLIQPEITSPTPGTTATFSWTLGDSSVENYKLWVGTSVGARDVASSRGLDHPASSYTVNGLPGDGSTVYVRLRVKVDGSYVETDYQYMACSDCGGGEGGGG